LTVESSSFFRAPGGASARTIADDAAMTTTPRKTPPDQRQPEFRELRIRPPHLGSSPIARTRTAIVRAAMDGGNLNQLR